MVLTSTRHEPGNWLHPFYSPPIDEGGIAVATLTLEHDGWLGIHLGMGTDVTIIAACLELEAALATIRQQAQAHHAQGWVDPQTPDDVPLAETELAGMWGDR